MFFYQQNTSAKLRYFGYREPPNSANPYALTSVFWRILAAKIIFVFIFIVSSAIFTKILIFYTALQSTFKATMQSVVPLEIKEDDGLEGQIITNVFYCFIGISQVSSSNKVAGL